MTKQSVSLPDKLSELARVGLNDLEAIEKTPGYRVDMTSWHEPAGVCWVCMAGAVMARSLNANARMAMGPYSFDGDTADKLFALDALRRGRVGDALDETGLDGDTYLDRLMPKYEDGPEEFKAAFRKLIADLGEAGL